MKHEDLVASGWVRRLGAVVRVTDEVTCRVRRYAAGDKLDFFLVSSGLAALTHKPRCPDEPCKVHRPVFMGYDGDPHEADCRGADTPRVFPPYWPIGCFPHRPNWAILGMKPEARAEELAPRGKKKVKKRRTATPATRRTPAATRRTPARRPSGYHIYRSQR